MKLANLCDAAPLATVESGGDGEDDTQDDDDEEEYQLFKTTVRSHGEQILEEVNEDSSDDEDPSWIKGQITEMSKFKQLRKRKLNQKLGMFCLRWI